LLSPICSLLVIPTLARMVMPYAPDSRREHEPPTGSGGAPHAEQQPAEG